jgi:hypothetical protein
VKQIPKEKAEELVSKMLKEVGYDTDLAVPCALIAVDEILNTGLLEGTTTGVLKKYWEEVKQEIENLKTK